MMKSSDDKRRLRTKMKAGTAELVKTRCHGKYIIMSKNRSQKGQCQIEYRQALTLLGLRQNYRLKETKLAWKKAQNERGTVCFCCPFMKERECDRE